MAALSSFTLRARAVVRAKGALWEGAQIQAPSHLHEKETKADDGRSGPRVILLLEIAKSIKRKIFIDAA
jgi:hypothetical protein